MRSSRKSGLHPEPEGSGVSVASKAFMITHAISFSPRPAVGFQSDTQDTPQDDVASLRTLWFYQIWPISGGQPTGRTDTKQCTEVTSCLASGSRGMLQADLPVEGIAQVPTEQPRNTLAFCR